MIIAGDEPDIILITEILPKACCNTITTARLSITSYRSFFSFDPATVSFISKVRGVGIYVSEKLLCHQIHFDNSNFEEQVWIKLFLKGSDSLLIGCMYRSPSSDKYTSTLALCNLLSSIHGYSHVLICGDFNYPNINWSTLSCNTTYSQMFLDTIHDHCLFQHITEPTHYRPNIVANTLDLVFTNEDGMINSVEYLPGIGSSDHVCLRFSLLCYSNYTQVCRPKYNLNRADFDRMRQLLQDVNWEDTLNPLDIHSAWQFFASKFTDVVNRCIPLCINRKKKNIYVTCRVFSLRNRKHKLWNKYIRSKSDTDFQHYCKVRNELRNLTRILRINYENKLVSNVKINPRQFWKYVNSQLKVHPKIDSLQCLDNTVDFHT